MRPENNESSGLRFYSFGIVVADKDDDGDYIKATPIEELPLVKGKLSEVAYDYSVSGVDHKNIGVNASVKGVAFVVAKWTALDSGNRITAPNVYAGETVMLLRYGNSDDVYWMDIFREPRLRRLEHVVYAVSNLKDKGFAYDNDTGHFLTMSSRDQYISLHTSNNRDEPVGYDLKFDLAKGTVEFTDTQKNHFFLDSQAGNLLVELNNECRMKVPKTFFDTELNVINGSYSGDVNIDGEQENKKNIKAHQDIISMSTSTAISLTHHLHLYNPGPGGPTPSQPPTPA